MSYTAELNEIKKMYGEKFMKLCRKLFPSILDHEGVLIQILKDYFATNSRTLYEDLTENDLVDDFEKFIYCKIDFEELGIEIGEKKTPYELLKEVGYDLFECTSEEDIQKYKKYYKPGEELCTFIGGRLDRCIVFFAVRKDADKLKREEFTSPERDDSYGTSVMSIQFPKRGRCTVSIKNRYNNTVKNPDATYRNELDRIATGLKHSFSNLLKSRGLEVETDKIEKLNLPNYTVGPDGKYYKYNREINGTYYCPGNVIIDHGKIIKLEIEKQELIDYFIVDKQNKRITTYDPSIKDSFVDRFEDIRNIEVRKDKKTGNRTITIRTNREEEPIIIVINKDNTIIEYSDESLTEIGNNFLHYNKLLTELYLPNVKKIGNNFLYWNQLLTKLNLPMLEETGDNFINWNEIISEFKCPKLKKVGDYFLRRNKSLTKLNMPNLEIAGDDFLYWNEIISELNMPNLKNVGNAFLYSNKLLTELIIPNLKTAGNFFLGCNKLITKLYLQNLETTGDKFLVSNTSIVEAYFPKLKKKGDYFLFASTLLTKSNTPSTEITSKDIAELDSKSDITTQELGRTKIFFTNFSNRIEERE